MRKLLSMLLVCMSMLACLCTNALAIEYTATPIKDFNESENVIMRASGSFNMSISAYGKAIADKQLPLEAGETVRIYATYSPDNVSVDFGLIDSDGVFHYIGVSDGSIDETIEINERGNYTLAIRNNSGKAIQVSGFVKY